MSDKVAFELVPGALSATVHLHEINAGTRVLRGWTMISEGLTLVGQSEMAFTLVRSSDRAEDFPPFLLRHLPIVRQLASEGRIVGEGGATAYRPAAMKALGPFAGIGYAAPDRSLSVLLPPGCLIGVLLTEGEVEMWMRCFPERVLSKLGQLHQFFPYPFWSDPGRPSVYAAGDSQISLMSELPKFRAEGSSATLTGGTLAGGEISLRMRPTDARFVADRIAADGAVAVMVGRDPSVLAALVWEPGQDAPTAIGVEGTDGAELAGWFVVLVPAKVAHDDVGMREDGFTVLLSDESASRLATSLRGGEDFRLAEVGKSPALVIGFNQPEAYENPVDGRTYVSAGGWQTFRPKTQAMARKTVESTTTVRLEGVRLLSSQDEFSASVDAKPLAALNEFILAAAIEALGATSTAFELLVQCKLSATARPHFRLAIQGHPDQKLIRHFNHLLESSPDLRSRRATILFQTHVVVPGKARLG
jgi:hypothetical protein